MRGSGKAEIFVMLAHPVGHAKSPGIFNEIFEQQGLDSLMVPLTCRPEDFETFWAGITAAENIRGVIVSVPYRSTVFHKCAAAHDRAARVKSANAVRRRADGSWYADNFDGSGFIDALEANGHALAGRRVLQVGAGGAGSSIAYGLSGVAWVVPRNSAFPPCSDKQDGVGEPTPSCLAEAGAAEIRLCDADEGRAAALAALVAKAFPTCRIAPGPADPPGLDMAVNATPMGMHTGDPLPLAVTRLTPRMTVADIIMEPAETALLRAARERGCRVQPGRPMMDVQVQGMSAFFDIARTERGHG